MLRLLLAAVVLGLAAKPGPAHGSSTPPGEGVYVVDPGLPVHPLDAYAEVLVDSAGDFDFAAARRAPPQHWRPVAEVSEPYGARYHGRHFAPGAEAYFYRVAVQTPDSLDAWELHFEDRLHHNNAWIRGNGRVVVRAYLGDSLLWTRTTGVDVPRGERDLAGRRTVDRVRAGGLPPGRVVSLVARIEPNSYGFPAYPNASLRAPGYLDYHPAFPWRVLFNAFVFGVMSITLVAHLLLLGYLRERVYGWFALWLGLCTLTQAMTVGVQPGDWLPLRHPDLRFLVWLVVPNMMLFASWLFGRAFVGTAAKYPRLDRAMLALPLAMVGIVVVQGVRIVFFDASRPMTALAGHYPALTGLALCGLALGLILSTRRDDALARYFGVGATVASAFLVLGGLWAMRLVRLSFDPFAAGMFAQVVLYSVGLAYRQRLRARAAQASALAAERGSAEVARMRDLEEVKARLFANVSHELRTPLALIAGPLQQARRRAAREAGEPPPTVPLTADEYEVVRDNAGRLGELVEQLLDLSRLEHGGMQLFLRRGGLAAHVRTLVHAFESLAEGAGVRLAADLPEACPEAVFDADKLTKIISNLVANAVKYTPPRGEVTVALRCGPERYVVEVSDTGRGIPAAEVARVFERFYRAGSTEAAGAGIGLALVKELVDLHGGSVEVSSEEGRGSSFRVSVPCTLAGLPDGATWVEEASTSSRARHSDAAATAPPTPVSTSGATAGGSRREAEPSAATVLVVEDNEQLCRFIAEALAEQPYRVLTAGDGRQGERMATEHVPDLVLSDVMMPGQDGYALCHALKTNPKTSHVPVVLLTAKADRAARHAGLTQGADAYLTKPFDVEELLLRVRNLLEARERLWAHFREQDLTLLPEVDARSLDDQFVQSVAATIAERLGDEDLSVDVLARAVGYSRSQLTRKLRALTGKTPNGLITEMRLAEAQRQLARGSGTVSEIAYRVGYANPSYFAKRFRERYGRTPSEVSVEEWPRRPLTTA